MHYDEKESHVTCAERTYFTMLELQGHCWIRPSRNIVVLTVNFYFKSIFTLITFTSYFFHSFIVLWENDFVGDS